MDNDGLAPKLKQTLTLIERQNDIKAKLKRTFTKLDEGKHTDLLT